MKMPELVLMVHLIALGRSGMGSGVPRAALGSVQQILAEQISRFSGEPFSTAVVLCLSIWVSLSFSYYII